MRILIVHDFGTRHGGAEQMMFRLRQALRRRGHDARWFASSATPFPLLPNAADYECFATTSAARRVLQVANPWAARSLRRVLHEFRPDVVHVRLFLNHLSPLIMRELKDWPTVLHVANYELICPLTTKRLPDGSACHARSGFACSSAGCLPLLGGARVSVQNALRARWSSCFDTIVANSQWVRQRLTAEGVPVEATIWNGVPARDARPPLSSPPTVGYAGRLIPEKGVDVLLRAMPQVLESVPDAHLIIAGDGPERARLTALCTESNIAQAVTFLGHLPPQQREARFDEVWVQSVPSVWEEPFGIVAAEAMMRGTALVVSRTGGLPEQVVEGETGFTVPPGDASALAGALTALLNDREFAERLGRAGHARALAEFSEDRFVDRFERVYERIGDRPRRSEAATSPTTRT